MMRRVSSADLVGDAHSSMFSDGLIRSLQEPSRQLYSTSDTLCVCVCMCVYVCVHHVMMCVCVCMCVYTMS